MKKKETKKNKEKERKKEKMDIETCLFVALSRSCHFKTLVTQCRHAQVHQQHQRLNWEW